MVELIVFLLLYNIADALHDKYIIEGRRVINKYKERMWHGVDAVIKISIGTYVATLLMNANLFLIVIVVASLRALVFNLFLNWFRSKNIFHLSKAGIEGYFTKRNEKWLYWILNLIILLICLIIL